MLLCCLWIFISGLTVPLITTDSGDKYGKSAQNAVWLNSDRTSPFELYQFLIRTADADVEKLLKMFTFLSLPEINEQMRKHKVNTTKILYIYVYFISTHFFILKIVQANPDKRIPHETLARNVTTLIHGGIITIKYIYTI